MSNKVKEIWKPVVGYENLYEVSNMGFIRSLKRQTISKRNIVRNWESKPIKVIINPRGYAVVNLYLNRKMKQYRIHRLVAISFIPNPHNKPYVNHLDGVKSNNNINNLEWCTSQENSIHAVKTGLLQNSSRKGDQHNTFKVTFSEVQEIRKLRKQGYSLTDISSKYNLSKDYTSKLINNKHRIYQ